MQGYEDAFELRMVPQDLVVYQRHFQACVDNSLDCSDVIFIMRALGQVRRSHTHTFLTGLTQPTQLRTRPHTLPESSLSYFIHSAQHNVQLATPRSMCFIAPSQGVPSHQKWFWTSRSVYMAVEPAYFHVMSGGEHFYFFHIITLGQSFWQRGQTWLWPECKQKKQVSSTVLQPLHTCVCKHSSFNALHTCT